MSHHGALVLPVVATSGTFFCFRLPAAAATRSNSLSGCSKGRDRKVSFFWRFLFGSKAHFPKVPPTQPPPASVCNPVLSPRVRPACGVGSLEGEPDLGRSDRLIQDSHMN